MAPTRTLNTGTVGSWLRALRPKQWVKNVLVVAAPAAAGTLDSGPTVARTFGAIAAFIIASGSIYLFNDAADADLDRVHPTKRHRPIPAGEIQVAVARRVGAVLAASATVGAVALDPAFGLVIAVYLAVNVSYSAGVKHWPWIELAAVASGFLLRAIGGGAATATPLSSWFLVVVSSVALFVVVGKRSAELRRTSGNGGRPALGAYTAGSLKAVSTASAATAVVAYALWIVNQDLVIDWLAILSLVPFAGSLARYAAVIESGRGEDPEDILIGDRAFQALALLWVVVYGFARYG